MGVCSQCAGKVIKNYWSSMSNILRWNMEEQVLNQV